MKILLTAHGSRGDVYPMVALASEFIRRGHEAVMLTQGHYSNQLEKAGIQGIYTSEDMRELMTTMGSDWRSIRRMMDWARQSLEEEFRLLEGVSGDADLLVSTNQEFSTASIAEWRNIPAYRLSYIPAIPGDHTPPLIPWQNLPVPLNRMIWRGFGAGLDAMSKKTVNRWRTNHRLPAVGSLTPHMTSIFLTLYGFSSTLAPPHPSWPAESFRYCGYCFEENAGELPTELEVFLKAGEKPVYIGFGSVSVPDPDRMTRMALQAAMNAGCRLVIGRGWTGLGSPKVLAEDPRWQNPERVLVVGDVPHDRLFTRVAGVCHHGGAGTTHRAARSGVPQFIMPLFTDQHFWGDRIYHCGAGPKPLLPKKVTADSLTGVFRSFRDGHAFRDAAEVLAESVTRERGTDAAYELIMETMEQRRAGAA